MSEHVIMTSLRSRCKSELFLTTLENVMISRNNIETIGVLLYTNVILKRLMLGLPIKEVYFRQSFLNACFRSVCKRYEKRDITFKPVIKINSNWSIKSNMINTHGFDDITENKYIRSNYKSRVLFAKHEEWGLNSDNKHILDSKLLDIENEKKKDYKMAELEINNVRQTMKIVNLPNEKGITEIMNSSSRRYLTSFANSIFDSIENRQKKVIAMQIKRKLKSNGAKYSKYVMYYIIQRTTCKINHQRLTDISKYKTSTIEEFKLLQIGKYLKDLIYTHSSFLPCKETVKNYKYEWGILQAGKYGPRDNGFLFLEYQYFMLGCIEHEQHICRSDEKKRATPRKFQLIPQYLPKLRYIDIGTSQLIELIKIMDDVKFKNKSNLYMRRIINDLWNTSFKNIPKDFTGTITTDGITCRWHIKNTRNITDTKKRKLIDNGHKCSKSAHAVKTICNLENKHYGVHGVDFFLDGNVNCNLISVDPGHANIIMSIKKPVKDKSCVSENNERYVDTKRAKQRYSKHRKQTSLGIFEYKLTNKNWRRLNGSEVLCKRIEQRTNRMGMSSIFEDLQHFDKRSSKPVEYLSYTNKILSYLPIFNHVLSHINTRRWKFEAFKREQHAVEKLCMNLLKNTNSKYQSLVVWGNGGFGPTSKGHASSPNKKLQKQISHRIPLCTSTEYLSSKRSCCCRSSVMTNISHNGRRASVFFCMQCNGILSRDTSAAINIMNSFEFQRKTKSSELLFN